MNIKINSLTTVLKGILVSPLYRNAFYLMLNTLVTSFLGFFFWLIVARFYSEAEVGFGSAVISAINLLIVIALGGLNFSIIRFLPGSRRPQSLLNTSFTLGGLTSFTCAIIFVLGLGWWSPALKLIQENHLVLSFFIIIAILATLSILMDVVLIARRHAGAVFIKNVAASVLKIGLVIALALFRQSSGIVSSWGLSIGITLVAALFWFSAYSEKGYKPRPALNLGGIRELWWYSGLSYIGFILSRAPVYLLPLLVINLLGNESNAHFYIAWMIANLLYAVPSSVSQSLFVEGAHLRENMRQNVVKSLKFTFLILVPSALGIIAISSLLLGFFGPGYLSDSLHLLWLLCLSSLFLGVSEIYTSILRLNNRLTELNLIQGITAGCILLFSFIFLPIYGLVSVGYVTLTVWGAASLVLGIRMARLDFK